MLSTSINVLPECIETSEFKTVLVVREAVMVLGKVPSSNENKESISLNETVKVKLQLLTSFFSNNFY